MMPDSVRTSFREIATLAELTDDFRLPDCPHLLALDLRYDNDPNFG